MSKLVTLVTADEVYPIDKNTANCRETKGGIHKKIECNSTMNLPGGESQ
jgi:hypothetical protein